MVIVTAFAAPPAFAQEQPRTFLGVPCNPTLLPKEPGACNLVTFLEFLRNIINFLLTLAIPLAVGFIAWGAFVIITAGGSEEKVKKGRGIITAAVVGIAIALGSWLIITTFQNILKGIL